MKRNIALYVLFLVWSSTSAAEISKCPQGSLLAGRFPLESRNIKGNLRLLVDGVATFEGAQWDSEPTVLLDNDVSYVVWDLGVDRVVRRIYLQADGNDRYVISGSANNKDWEVLSQIDVVNMPGLRQRSVSIQPKEVRYIRLQAAGGDGLYSVSELQVFCPSEPQPSVRFVPAPPAAVSASEQQSVPLWKPPWELVLALMGLTLLYGQSWLARRSAALQRTRKALFVTLGILAGFTYVKFFQFPNGFLHIWEIYHYYIGAKYFPELGYEHLYECTLQANVESGFLENARRIKIRNLRTNLIEQTDDVLAHPERCKSHFSQDRWRDFVKDVSWFREQIGIKRIDDAMTDHGYNPTPVWGIAGTLLANLHHADRLFILSLASIDCVHLIGIVILIGWAFGWQVTSVAVLVMATNFPSHWFWSGGAFLRFDWLFWLVCGICLLKKERYVGGGMALAYSALLRVFPVFVLVSLVLSAIAISLDRLLRTRPANGVDVRMSRLLLGKPGSDCDISKHTRVFLGVVVATALLVPTSIIVAGGPKVYSEFIQNTQKYTATPMGNSMGTRTLIAFEASTAQRYLMNAGQLETEWCAARVRTFKARIFWFLGAASAFAYLLMRGVYRNRELWLAAALGVAVIPAAGELLCYYYSMLIVLALLCARRMEVGICLLGLTAISQVIGWAPEFAGVFVSFKLSQWNDEQFVLHSAFVVLAMLCVLSLFAFRHSFSGPSSRDLIAPSKSP